MNKISLPHLLLIIELLIKKISHNLYDKVFLGINRESHFKRRGEDKNRTTPSSFLRARFQTCRVESGRLIGQSSPIGGKPRTGLGRKPAGQEGRQYYSLPPLKEGTNEPTTHATNAPAR